MPFGFPSVTVATRSATATNAETFAAVRVKEGEAVEILGRGASQDGATGDELSCRVRGALVLLSASALRLSS